LRSTPATRPTVTLEELDLDQWKLEDTDKHSVIIRDDVLSVLVRIVKAEKARRKAILDELSREAQDLGIYDK
jgi:hypothetical protein